MVDDVFDKVIFEYYNSIGKHEGTSKDLERVHKYRILKRIARTAWLQVMDVNESALNLIHGCLSNKNEDIQIIGVHVLTFYLKFQSKPKLNEFLDAFYSVHSWKVLDQAYRNYCMELLDLDSVQADLHEFILKEKYYSLSQEQRRVFISIVSCALRDGLLESKVTTKFTQWLLDFRGYPRFLAKSLERYFEALLFSEPSKFYAIYYSLTASEKEQNEGVVQVLNKVIKENKA